MALSNPKNCPCRANPRHRPRVGDACRARRAEGPRARATDTMQRAHWSGRMQHAASHATSPSLRLRSLLPCTTLGYLRHIWVAVTDRSLACRRPFWVPVDRGKCSTRNPWHFLAVARDDVGAATELERASSRAKCASTTTPDQNTRHAQPHQNRRRHPRETGNSWHVRANNAHVRIIRAYVPVKGVSKYVFKTAVFSCSFSRCHTF